MPILDEEISEVTRSWFMTNFMPNILDASMSPLMRPMMNGGRQCHDKRTASYKVVPNDR